MAQITAGATAWGINDGYYPSQSTPLSHSNQFAVSIGNLIIVSIRPVGIADSGGVVDCHDTYNNVYQLQNAAIGPNSKPPAGWSPMFATFATQTVTDNVVTISQNISHYTALIVQVYQGVMQWAESTGPTGQGQYTPIATAALDVNVGDWMVASFNSTYQSDFDGVAPSIRRYQLTPLPWNPNGGYPIALLDREAAETGPMQVWATNIGFAETNPFPYSYQNAIRIIAGDPPITGFDLRSSAPSISVPQGGSSTFTVSVDYVTGFSNPVTIVAQGLPPNSSFSISPGTTTSTAVITIYGWTELASGDIANATVGTWTINVTGSAVGSNNANTLVDVAIVAPTVGTIQIIATGGV